MSENELADGAGKKFARLIVRGNGSLTHLDLRGNYLGDEGVAAVALALGSVRGHAINSLFLGDNGCGAEGAEALARGLKVNEGGLMHLDLWGNELEAASAHVALRAIAGAVTQLDLYATGLGDAGVARMMGVDVDVGRRKGVHGEGVKKGVVGGGMGGNQRTRVASEQSGHVRGRGNGDGAATGSSAMSLARGNKTGGVCVSLTKTLLLLEPSQTLRRLDIGGNNLSSVSLAALATVIGDPRCRLEVVKMADNNFEGAEEEVVGMLEAKWDARVRGGRGRGKERGGVGGGGRSGGGNDRTRSHYHSGGGIVGTGERRPLSHVSLRGSNMGNRGACCIGRCIGSGRCAVESLDLRSNGIGMQGLVQLLNGLEGMEGRSRSVRTGTRGGGGRGAGGVIRRLDVRGNLLGKDGVVKVGEFVRRCEGVEVVCDGVEGGSW
jgi:hypothetical protein